MAVQNLISAVLTAEAKTAIMQKLNEIKKELDFLLTLQPDEIKSLCNPGNNYLPFIEKAYSTVSAYPQIMPGVFSIQEFSRDYQVSKDLRSIADRIKELSDTLDNTMTAVNSDAMAGALEVYASVKQNRSKVPGLNVNADELGFFFKRTGSRQTSSEN
jgi:hypothetical protein